MTSNAKITTQMGRYSALKSLQPLNLDELQYLHHGGLTPPKRECQGFFAKCFESFKSNIPYVKQLCEEMFFERSNSQSDVYGHAD